MSKQCRLLEEFPNTNKGRGLNILIGKKQDWSKDSPSNNSPDLFYISSEVTAWGGYNCGFWYQTALSHILVSFLPSYLALAKLFNFSLSQIPQKVALMIK
jgi:hypothetical protein